MLDNCEGIRVTAPGGGEDLDIFGVRMIVKSDGGAIPVFLGEHLIPPGFVVPPHSHTHDDEMFYILDGELTLLGASGETKVGPGSYVELPRGGVHGFRNDTDREVRFLVICQPGIQAGEMFRHFDRAGRATPHGLAPAEIVGICAQYGVRMG
jgi:mannose-6-phosphate isomerase-like protein (cupin superfamily)